MSKVVMTGEQPLIDSLEMTNAQLATAHATAIEARQTSVQATAAADAASVAQSKAYGLLADHVSVLAEGDASFILSTGYGVRNNPAPYPALEPPYDVRTRINGTPGRIIMSWKGSSAPVTTKSSTPPT